MKQLKVNIKNTLNNKDWGTKNVVTATWGSSGNIAILHVDFMEDGMRGGYALFFKEDPYSLEFFNVHRNLKATII